MEFIKMKYNDPQLRQAFQDVIDLCMPKLKMFDVTYCPDQVKIHYLNQNRKYIAKACLKLAMLLQEDLVEEEQPSHDRDNKGPIH